MIWIYRVIQKKSIGKIIFLWKKENEICFNCFSTISRNFILCLYKSIFFLVTLFDILDGCKRKFCWQTNNKFWFEYTELLLHLQNIYFDIDSLHSKFFSRCNLKKGHDRFTMVLENLIIWLIMWKISCSFFIVSEPKKAQVTFAGTRTSAPLVKVNSTYMKY